jgi:hypothetical protein
LVDLRFANRQPLGVLGLVKENRDLLIADPRPRAKASPPFFDHDTAFFVDFFGIEGHAAGEIGQRLHAFFDDPLAIRWQLEQVDGLVERRVSIEVRPQARATRLERGDELTRLEVGRPVERHVLEEVREPPLVVRFVNRSGLDRQLQHDALLGSAVAPDVVTQPVRERPGRHGRVERQAIGRSERWRLSRRLRRALSDPFGCGLWNERPQCEKRERQSRRALDHGFNCIAQWPFIRILKKAS